MSNKKVLIIGATGHIGSLIVDILSKQNVQMRGTTRQKNSTAKSIEYFQFDVQAPSNVKELFEGVSRAFIMVPAGKSDQFEVLKPLIDEAKRRKLDKVVLMSSMGTDIDPNGGYALAEKALSESDLNYNIVRPNWFMQNFHTFWLHGILKYDKVIVPAADSKTSFIDIQDIALAMAKLLIDDSFKEKVYTLTGSETLHHDEVAKMLSAELGRNIVYEDVPEDSFRGLLLGAGVPEKFTDYILTIFGYVRRGLNNKVTDDFKLITNREPKTFSTFVRENKTKWLP